MANEMRRCGSCTKYYWEKYSKTAIGSPPRCNRCIHRSLSGHGGRHSRRAAELAERIEGEVNAPILP